MNVMPTMEGGLRLEIENGFDWVMLEDIAKDALGDDGEKLAERLGALMDEESDWDEVVIPELRVFFSEQVGVVARAVARARREAADGPEDKAGTGTLFIAREEAESWYGALNQARLGLEARFQFGPSDEMELDGVRAFSEDKLRGFLRMRFYANLQGLLLDYAME
jgi:hypothetical protein